MYLSLLPASLVLSLVVAQSTTSAVQSVSSAAAGTTSVCADQPVLEACLASTEAIAEGCASTDYGCLCQKWSAVLVCFNNCPNDSRQPSVLSSKETYCNDASVYTSSTSAPISAAVSSTYSAATTTTSGSDSGSETTTSAGAIQTASGTSSSATSSATGKSGAGSNMVIGVGQVALGLAGVVGALL